MAPNVLLKEEEDLGARFGVDNSIVPIEVDQARVSRKLIICSKRGGCCSALETGV